MAAPLPKEKGYLLSALALAIVSAGVCGWLTWRATAGPRTAVQMVDLADTPYVETVKDAEVVKTDVWAAPAAQTRGRDWVYDAFTPPEIYYNARSKHFIVKPPAALVVADDSVVEEPFGLELVSVRAEPFRLQLIGYVGTERGTFENVATGEVFLAGSGYRVAKLGVTIQSFKVTSTEIKIAQSMTTRQLVASAVVLDEKTGKTVTITHRERFLTGGYSAFVAPTGDASTREVRTGETFKAGDASYRVDKIELSPPSVELTKESPSLAQPDHRTLTPRESEDAPAPTGAPAPLTQ